MERPTVPEAKIVDTEHGRHAEGDGWFVINMAGSMAIASEQAGYAFAFEPSPRAFPHFGINVHVLQPGEPNCLYHAESSQEAFLVLQGECTLIVEGEERTLRQWDFFYAQPWTEHVFVGAGDGPCAILMVGARIVPDEVIYPVNEVAAKHGASVEKETPNPTEAYAGWERPAPARRPWPPE